MVIAMEKAGAAVLYKGRGTAVCQLALRKVFMQAPFSPGPRFIWCIMKKKYIKMCAFFFVVLPFFASARESLTECLPDDSGQGTEEQFCEDDSVLDSSGAFHGEVFTGSELLFGMGNNKVPVFAEFGVALRKGGLVSKGGISFSENTCAFTIKTAYDFLDTREKGMSFINNSVFSCFLMGHAVARIKVSSQCSAYAGIIYKYCRDNFLFSAEGSLGYVLSGVRNPEIKPFSNFDSTISFLFDFNFAGSNRISVLWSSYEFFRHPLLGCPSLTLTYSHDFKSNLGLDIGLFVRYIDFFTISSYLDSCGINLTVRYAL